MRFVLSGVSLGAVNCESLLHAAGLWVSTWITRTLRDTGYGVDMLHPIAINRKHTTEDFIKGRCVVGGRHLLPVFVRAETLWRRADAAGHLASPDNPQCDNGRLSHNARRTQGLGGRTGVHPGMPHTQRRTSAGRAHARYTPVSAQEIAVDPACNMQHVICKQHTHVLSCLLSPRCQTASNADENVPVGRDHVTFLPFKL